MRSLSDRIFKLPNIEYIFLSLILVLGFFVRLYKIDNPLADWHSWRQADTSSVSRIFVEEGINIFTPRYQDISSAQTGVFNPEGFRMVELPLFNIAQASLFDTFPQLTLEVWGRLVAIIASLISVLFIFLLGERYVGKWGGLIAAFFFAFLPFNVYYSRTILPDPLSVSFALAALWFFESSFIISAVLLGISMLVKPFSVFYTIPLLYILYKEESQSFFLNKKYWLYASIVLIPFAAWRVRISQFPEGIAHYKWAFNSDRILGKPSYFKWIFGERLGRLILGGWGLIPFSFGLVDFDKKKAFPHYFLAGALLYMAVFATANVRHDYYQIFLIPPVALLLAKGSLNLWSYGKEKLLTRGLLLFSVLMMFIVSGFQVGEFYKINHPEIVEAGRALDAIASKDALVVAPYNKDTAFLYQTGRSGWPFVDVSIEDMIEKGASYYVSVNLNDPDTLYVLENFEVIKRTDSFIIANLSNSLN